MGIGRGREYELESSVGSGEVLVYSGFLAELSEVDWPRSLSTCCKSREGQ